MSKRFAVTAALVALPVSWRLPPARSSLRRKRRSISFTRTMPAGDCDAITRADVPAQPGGPPGAGRRGKLRVARQQVGSDQGGVHFEFAYAEAQFAPGAAITALRGPTVRHQPTDVARSVAGGTPSALWRQGAMSSWDRLFVSTQGSISTMSSATPAAGRPSRRSMRASPPSRGGAGTEVLERSIAHDTSAKPACYLANGAARHGARQSAPWTPGCRPPGACRDRDTQGVSRACGDMASDAAPETAIEAFTRRLMQHQLARIRRAEGHRARRRPRTRSSPTDGCSADGSSTVSSDTAMWRACRAALAAGHRTVCGVGLALTLFKLDRAGRASRDGRAPAAARHGRPLVDVSGADALHSAMAGRAETVTRAEMTRTLLSSSP
jgi:hypothetical protein